MGRTEEFARGKDGSDARWQSHYNNAVERLYPDAVHPITGKQTRPLKEHEDRKAVSEANKSMRNDSDYS